MFISFRKYFWSYYNFILPYLAPLLFRSYRLIKSVDFYSLNSFFKTIGVVLKCDSQHSKSVGISSDSNFALYSIKLYELLSKFKYFNSFYLCVAPVPLSCSRYQFISLTTQNIMYTFQKCKYYTLPKSQFNLCI